VDRRHKSFARRSDHNPDAAGIVRAIDIDRDLSGKAKPDLMPYLADQIRVAQSVAIKESLTSSSQADCFLSHGVALAQVSWNQSAR
jgi:hypothetical protein